MSSVSFARAELLQGLKTGEIRLAFQPQIDLGTQRIVGFEGVARWHHGELGILTPGLFLGLAASEGLLGALSRTLIGDAAKAVSSWRARGFKVDVGVNISASDMTDPDFGKDILATVQDHGALPHWIILEASEEALAHAGEAAFAGLEVLAGLGFKIALDAKGPPIVSLDKRARALFCQLKCGGSTMLSVASQLNNLGASSFIRRLDAARGANLPVVAVGAESQAAMDLCLQLGFTRLQGKVISMPVSVDRCTQFLERIGVHAPQTQAIEENILDQPMAPLDPMLDISVLENNIDQDMPTVLPVVDQPLARSIGLTIFSLDLVSNDTDKIVEAA